MQELMLQRKWNYGKTVVFMKLTKVRLKTQFRGHSLNVAFRPCLFNFQGKCSRSEHKNNLWRILREHSWKGFLSCSSRTICTHMIGDFLNNQKKHSSEEPSRNVHWWFYEGYQRLNQITFGGNFSWSISEPLRSQSVNNCHERDVNQKIRCVCSNKSHPVENICTIFREERPRSFLVSSFLQRIEARVTLKNTR